MDRKKEIEALLSSLCSGDYDTIASSLSDKDYSTLKKMLEVPQPPTPQKPPKKRRGRGRGKKKKKATSVTVPNFLDGVTLSPSEAQELKKAGTSDKEAGLHQPKGHGMPKAARVSKVEITCRVCGSKELVSPALITPERDRYKCNKCSCSAG